MGNNDFRQRVFDVAKSVMAGLAANPEYKPKSGGSEGYQNEIVADSIAIAIKLVAEIQNLEQEA